MGAPPDALSAPHIEGRVIVDGDDPYGDGVNLAARREEEAETGGICLSVDRRRIGAPITLAFSWNH